MCSSSVIEIGRVNRIMRKTRGCVLTLRLLCLLRVVSLKLQTSRSFDDIYCRPYTYCRWRQIIRVLAAHIAVQQHILSPEYFFT